MNNEGEIKEKPFVFLSSSIIGNQDLRSILTKYFEDNGYNPIGYGDISRGPRIGIPGIVKNCLHGVHYSHFFVLVINKRYGNPDIAYNEKNISLTEREFIEASEMDIPRFIFCRKEVWIVNKVWEENENLNFSFDNEYDYPEELMIFLKNLRKKKYHIEKFWDLKELIEILDRMTFSIDALRSEANVESEIKDLEVNK